MIRIVLVLATLVLVGHEAAFADAGGYKCTVKQYLKLGSDGVLRPSEIPLGYPQPQEFVVDRASGRILGSLISSDGWLGKHEIMDPGGNGQSYKLILTSPPPYVNFSLLQVRDYEDGFVKPFMLTDNDTVYTGTCTPLR